MKSTFEANLEDEQTSKTTTTRCDETVLNIDHIPPSSDQEPHGTIPPSTSHQVNNNNNNQHDQHRPSTSSADTVHDDHNHTNNNNNNDDDDDDENNNTNTDNNLNSINIDTDNGNRIRTNTGGDVTRSRNSLSSILNLYSNTDFFFDCNTFKQVKRLYSGMLLVAMAYSITMVIMMVVLYKSIPDMNNHLIDGRFRMSPPLSSSSSSHYPSIPVAAAAATITTTTSSPFQKDSDLDLDDDDPEMMLDDCSDSESELSPAIPTSASPPMPISIVVNNNNNNKSTFSTYFKRSHQTRTHLDQVISINFLTSILYLMAFYAAQREFYNLTVAFTTMLAVSMIVSLVRIISEGAHFPNNLMGLLLRMSIVFVALIYSSQIRRKQLFLTNGNPFWLNDHRIIGHRSNNPSTVQWINDMLDAAAIVGDSNKTDEHLIREYQDKPPGYEEALRCPVPNVRPVPTSSCPQIIYPKPGQ